MACFGVLLVVLCGITLSYSASQCDERSELFGSDCWCSKGYYSSDGRAPCKPCKYSFNTKVGSSACTCYPGFVGENGKAPCTACGKFSGTPGKEEWSREEYFFAGSGIRGPEETIDIRVDQPGHSSCKCLIGAYGVSGRSPCLQCPPDSSSYFNWGTLELDIPVPRSDECRCSPGYRNVKGGHPSESDPCVPCPEYATSKMGATSCPFCLLNAYRKTPDAPCEPCPAGSIGVSLSAAVSVFACAKCDVGYYSPTGDAPCVPCADRFTTTGIGQTTCMPWGVVHSSDPTRAPTVAPTGQSVITTQCPSSAPATNSALEPRHSSTNFTDSTTGCLPGFYSATGKGPDCRRCPKGMTSTQDLTYCVPCIGYAPRCRHPKVGHLRKGYLDP
jgi:hypothetical protein